MKLLPSLAGLSLTLLSASTPALAQQEMPRGRDFAKGPSPGEMQRLRRNEPDGNTEKSALREASTLQHAEDLKPVQVQGLIPVQGRERLSPEERRQLRRDINAAGRDIYRRHKPD